LTDDAMRALNYQVDGKKREPEDVAREFLAAHVKRACARRCACAT
jgi:glycine betaine/choline ABC-type transport system substrate-binding protein